MSGKKKDGKYRVIRRYKNELQGEKLILWTVKGRLGQPGRKEGHSANENIVVHGEVK